MDRKKQGTAGHKRRSAREENPNPDPEEAGRMAARFEAGLDIWTGEPLTGRDALGWLAANYGYEDEEDLDVLEG